jgi:hypothetical protein
MMRTKLVIGVGATALALSACGGVAATPSQTVHHTAAPAIAQQAGTDMGQAVRDLAKAKRGVMQQLAQRAGSR